MAESKLKIIKVKNQKDAEFAGSTASKTSSRLGFDKIGCAQIFLAVSEIVGNTVKFAGQGIVEIRLSKNRKTLEITVKDKGPGIEDLKKVMKEGYSTEETSLGIGLKAAKRAMDEFLIKTKVGKGTTIIMKKYLPVPEGEIEYGVVSLCDEKYTINGDAYVIKEFEGDKVILAVIDGLGEGVKANKAANLAKDVIEANYKLDLDVIIKKCHETLKKRSPEKGAQMELFLLTPRTFEYIGIGNVSIRIMQTTKKISLINQNGIVGKQMPTILRMQKYNNGRKLIVIMHSDGVNSNFIEEDLPLNKNAQFIADFIINNYSRKYGDATVLVAKRKK